MLLQNNLLKINSFTKNNKNSKMCPIKVNLQHLFKYFSTEDVLTCSLKMSEFEVYYMAGICYEAVTFNNA